MFRMPSSYLKLLAADNSSGQGVQVLELALPRTLDMYEFDRLNDEIARHADTQPSGRWILDMNGSDYVGSAILGLMVNLRQRIRTGNGRLAVCNLSDALAKAMKTCSLYNLFSVAATRDDAIKLVKSLR
jgi:anti-anti-sigma factor